MGGFVDNTTGSVSDAWENTSGSATDFVHDTQGSLIDVAKNSYNSAVKLASPVTDPMFSAADRIVGAIGLPKDTFKNLNTSMQDVADNSFDAMHKANDTQYNASRGVDKLVGSGIKRVQKGATSFVDRAINDPSGLLKDTSDLAVGAALAPVKPVIDLGSRATGGTGDGVGEIFGEDISKATENSQNAGVSGAKAVGGLFLAPATGGASLMMTGDELSKAAGSSGNIMKDLGANDHIAMGAHIAASIATGMQAPNAFADGGTTLGMANGVQTGSTFANPVMQGALQGGIRSGTMNAMMGGDADTIAKAAFTGGVSGGVARGLGNDPLGNGNDTALERALNAGAKQGIGAGVSAAVMEKDLGQVARSMVGGAAGGAGSSLIADGMNVRTEGGVQKHFSPDETGKMVADKGFSAPLMITQMAQGAWQGGTNASANSKAFADGAAIGMAGGFGGSAAQQATEAAGFGNTAQAGMNAVGTELGRGLESLKQQREREEEMLANLPTGLPQAPDTSSRGKFGGILRTGLDMSNYVSPAVLAAREAMNRRV